MEHPFLILRRGLTALAGSILLGALIAGCGGGGGAGTALPSTSDAARTTSSMQRVTPVDRANAPAVMSLVHNSVAYYAPMVGQKPRLLDFGTRSTQSTAGAGNDLTNFGGPTQHGGKEYNILVNATNENPWGGKISKFESDLFGSTMFTIVNQYNAGGAYASGGDYPITYSTLLPLQDSDIFNIVHTVIKANNLPVGYGSQFHVFLQSGVQQCSTSARGCYGVVYCAYHGSNDYTDVGHVLYSVEPYQNINGCQVSNTASPNGVLADSTASVLSHEVFETITDPDVAANNLAWYNNNKGEIGDICAPANSVPTGNVVLSATTWEIQPEYSNKVHDCSYAP
ncbi:MAG: hypothetical protein M3126_05940 [Candidatus Eremiobacteraeota bacterium]|nr:hypothetical protein [Candidatus Eremiobacteraeota bacterium]